MVNHNESESEDASHADEPRFRVRVCLQRFYSDERARAYVCVSPRRRVRWLQRRLRRLFALPRLRLLSRGHLLPPQEPLALLQPDDPVECVPAPGAWPLPCRPVDAELDETSRDVADNPCEVMETTVEEVERSPSPVHSGDLAETKRQALLMLEQLVTEPGAESTAEASARPRRRRVRRRRRTPASGADHEAAPARPREPPACREPPVCREPPACREPPVPAQRAHEPPAAALVLRNDLQPRAPRVVRPLPDRNTPPRLDTTPTEIIVA